VARRRPPTVHGLAIVDKPAGVTSHDVVDMLRRRLGERRVGHAGTLDPDATGVLLAGVGSATRLLRFLSGLDKVYTGEVVFGVETSTLDAAGDVTARHDMTGVTLADVRGAVEAHLVGPILQVPPMVSALKVDGRRLHELARDGIEVEREARPVTVRRFVVNPTADDNVFSIEVEVSSGTYVRSLAADLGHLLGGGAHLRALRRRSVGPFAEAEAAPPETCALLPVVEAMRGYARVTVDEATEALVRNGRVLDRFDGDGPWALVDAAGELLAVYEAFTVGSAKPAVVLVGAFQG
jgi:tRNA pseudouridine55 synthase